MPITVSRHSRRRSISLALVLAFATGAAGAEPDAAGAPSRDLAAGKDQRYFLIGPRAGAVPPKKGHGLLVVLPGGDGGEGFLPFVKQIHEKTLGPDWIATQPVAVKWTPDQQIIWPTEKSRTAGMKFTTEAFVEAVIADVKKRHPVDPARVFLLAWSSSGPSAYSIALGGKKVVAGVYIAMSVFDPRLLPPLERARGTPFFLDHSPADKVCPFPMAEKAAKLLEEKGAKVSLVTYEGGHGWNGDFLGRLRQGWKWLEENAAPPAKKKR